MFRLMCRVWVACYLMYSVNFQVCPLGAQGSFYTHFHWSKTALSRQRCFHQQHFWAHFGAVHEKGWWKLHFWHFSNKFWSCENLTRRRRRRRRRPRRPRLSAENYFLVDTEKFQSILTNWTKIAKTSLHFFLMAEATALISSSFPSLGLFIDLFFPSSLPLFTAHSPGHNCGR